MSTPHKCPVCNGSGSVSVTVYDNYALTTEKEDCRTCYGRGIVWEEEKESGDAFRGIDVSLEYGQTTTTDGFLV